MLSSLLIHVLCLSFTSSSRTTQAGETSKKCSTALQGVTFEPETCAKRFLESVAKQLRAASELLFVPGAGSSFLAKVEREWGVDVAVAEPFSICGEAAVDAGCVTETATPIQIGPTRLFSMTTNAPISALTVYVNGTAGQEQGLGQITITPTQEQVIVNLSSSNLCDGTNPAGEFFIGFQVDGTTDPDCQDPTNGQLIRSLDLSKLTGRSMAGTWALAATNGGSLTISAITFVNCPLVKTCSRDQMKALTNFPGFRVDPSTQMAHYTEDFFDPFGRFKQVTISKSLDELFYLRK